MQPTLAITIGDVNGIGPEVILKSFHRSELFTAAKPVLYGPLSAMEWWNRKLGTTLELRPISSAAEAVPSMLSVIDTGPDFDPEHIGTPTPESGEASLRAINAAYQACIDGSAAALVTAPISKLAIKLAGSQFAGHTDMLAHLAGAKAGEVMMLLYSNTMSVGLVSVHVPLNEVTRHITTESVSRIIAVADKELRQSFAITKPLIAVLALNPHAGEGGYIGTEEQERIIPAIKESIERGIMVEGPFPADGFFSSHNKRLYDIIIAMYHDQGLIPFKMQARGRGVNVSCGLPIVRTSPDHGTAYDIAGTGRAAAESMREAIMLACAIVRNRQHYG